MSELFRLIDAQTKRPEPVFDKSHVKSMLGCCRAHQMEFAIFSGLIECVVKDLMLYIDFEWPDPN